VNTPARLPAERAAPPDPAPPPGRFAKTQWTLVLAAGEGSDRPEARAALAELCRTYWYPLYAYVRRRGYPLHEAEDLTQEFFSLLLERNWLAGVRPEKGRFRTFLLTAMQRFLATRWHRDRAQKRGGGLAPLPLAIDDAERRYAHEPADPITPEMLFERRWALTVLENAFGALRSEMERAGRGAQFETYQALLWPDAHRLSQAEGAARLGVGVDALKMALLRLRRRFREILRAQLAATVESDAEVDEEIRHLFRIFGG